MNKFALRSLPFLFQTLWVFALTRFFSCFSQLPPQPTSYLFLPVCDTHRAVYTLGLLPGKVFSSPGIRSLFPLDLQVPFFDSLFFGQPSFFAAPVCCRLFLRARLVFRPPLLELVPRPLF